jgi:hypothetical protein
MLGERTHYVVETLADQNRRSALFERLLQPLNAARLQPRLQEVFEVLFAKEIEPVPAYAPQERMKNSCCEYAVRCVEDRSEQGKKGDASASCPALAKPLSVPGEEPDRPNGAQVEQTPLGTPESLGWQTWVQGFVVNVSTVSGQV